MPPPLPDRVANPSNAVVVSYQHDGTVRWTARIGTHTTFDRGWAIASLADGSIAVTGDFEERAFVASYSAAGKLRWLRRASAESAIRGVIAHGNELITAFLVDSDVVIAGAQRSLQLTPRAMDTALVRWSLDGEPLAAGRLAGEVPHSKSERDGDELDVGILAGSAAGRIAAVGRLWGTGLVEPGDLLRGGTRLVAKHEHDLALFVLDPN